MSIIQYVWTGWVSLVSVDNGPLKSASGPILPQSIHREIEGGARLIRCATSIERAKKNSPGAKGQPGLVQEFSGTAAVLLP